MKSRLAVVAQLWNEVPRPVRILCACQGVLSFGLGLAFPFFAIFLQRTHALSMTAVGAALSLSMVAAAASQGIGGTLSDKIGRRKVLLGALGGRIVTAGILALGIHDGWPVWGIVAAHVLSNLLSHAFEPAARGWVADHSPVKDRHRSYSLLRMATFAGYGLGPAVGGWVADRSYVIVFLLSAVVCAICAAAAAAFLKEGDDAARSEEGRSKREFGVGIDRNFRILCFQTAVLAIVMAQMVVPLSIYAVEFLGLKDSQMGLLLSLNAALVFFLQIPAVQVLQGTRLTAAIAIGSALYAAGFTWVGMSVGFVGLVLGVIVLAGAEILVPPALQALGANMSPKDWRGRYIGVLGFWKQVGSAVGPLAGCGGLEVARSVGMPGHWFLVAALGVFAAVAFPWLGRRLLPDEEGIVDDALDREPDF